MRHRKITPTTALYIHIPFCAKRCAYCDFHSIVFDNDLASKYVDAIERELELIMDKDRYVFKTAYIGGGTPTVLNEGQLKRLLSIINRHIDPSKLVEYTIEANPGTISAEKIGILREALVNRVSLGVQSFNNSHLRFMGRIHTSRDAFNAFSLLRGHGFTNINIDLIFGIPSQRPDEWEDDLKMAISLEPDHISTYALTYEKGTPLSTLISSGKVHKMGESEGLRMYKSAITLLTRHGFEHYEISNFAKKKKRCVHNIVYWGNQGYIGVGSGAYSFVNRRREANEADVSAYIKEMLTNSPTVRASTVKKTRIATFHERLSPRKHAAETLIMGLRMRSGISNERFHRQTGYRFGDLYRSQISRLVGAGFISLSKERLRLTKKGLYVADSIMMEFLN